MTSIPIGAAWRPYLRALAEAGIDVTFLGTWVAAGELPPARRRLLRAALTAAVGAASVPDLRAARSALVAARPATPGARSGLPFVDAGIRLPAEDPAEDGTSPGRRAVRAGAGVAAVLATTAAVTAGVAAAGRQWERRWLARLVRHGHRHPHVALGLRMAALYAAVVVPGRLLIARQGTQPNSRDVPAGGNAAAPPTA